MTAPANASALLALAERKHVFRCACVSRDARTCVAIRYRIDRCDAEPCDCACHASDEDDDDLWARAAGREE